MRFLFLLACLSFTTALSAQYTIESLPNQKLVNNSYVTNPDNILGAATVSQIDTMLRQLELKTTVQVAVVVVESIGEADITDFSQNLFRAWGIGQKEKDNGLLILFVNDKRTIRFHTGYGLEGVLPDITCKRIQTEFMLPAFRKGGYDEGMMAGLAQVEKVLTDPVYAQELKEPEKERKATMTEIIIFLCFFPLPLVLVLFGFKWRGGAFKNTRRVKTTLYPEMQLTAGKWILLYCIFPALIVAGYTISGMADAPVYCLIALYFYFMATCLEKLWRTQKVIRRFLQAKNYHQIVEFLRGQQWYWIFPAIVFPLPMLLYFFYHLSRKRIYRDHPRNCKKCGADMHKLDEKGDDEYLSEQQLKEEDVKSVDYDVWKCNTCGDTEVWIYVNKNTKYQLCPKCNTQAYHSVSRQTVTAASYSSSGKGEEKFACEFCHYEATAMYTIAQLTHSSSGSSSSGGSSSGGSWGGGSSGGGGSSSSW